MIRGIDVVVYVKTRTGEDSFGAPVWQETPQTVPNVLVGQPSAEDIVNELQLYGKHIAYTLGIPKGDTHDWGQCDGGVFWAKIPHLRRRDAGY